MKELVKSEYLAPEAEVVMMETEKVVLQVTSILITTFDPLNPSNPSNPSSIEDSVERTELSW